MKNNLWLKTMPPVFQNSGIEYFSAKKILETEQDNDGRGRKRKEVEDFRQIMACVRQLQKSQTTLGTTESRLLKINDIHYLHFILIYFPPP